MTLPMGDPQLSLLALAPSIVSNIENHYTAKAEKYRTQEGRT